MSKLEKINGINFGKHSISGKMKKTFTIISGVIVAIGVIGVASTNYALSSYKSMFELHNTGRGYMSQISMEYQELKNILSDMIFDYSGDTQSKLDEMIRLEDSIKDNMNEYKKIIDVSQFGEDFVNLDIYLNQYIKTADDAARYIVANDYNTAAKLISEDLIAETDKIKPIIDMLNKWHVDTAKKDEKEVNNLAIIAVVILVAIAVSGIYAVIVIGRKLRIAISSPIEKLLGATNEFSKGNLTVNFEDEIGELARALTVMSKNLRNILRNINNASEQVSVGSKEIANSAQVLAEGATEQASAVEELTTTVDMIAVQTQENAKNAEDVKEFMDVTKNGAMDGREQMAKMVEATEEIRKASLDISNIIKVIDDIAFQTNILALNAAVEAARAGSYGKGFAVVADEVRNLAVRSANAVKETTELIENSVRKTEVGSELAITTAKSLDKIVEDVTKIASLVNDIAKASGEQATGIQQVNIGIAQVSDVVQTTSATSQESAASSQELASQSESLREQISKFKL